MKAPNQALLTDRRLALGFGLNRWRSRAGRRGPVPVRAVVAHLGRGANQVLHTPVSARNGRKRIAQRFNAGPGAERGFSPVRDGRKMLTQHSLSVVPVGTCPRIDPLFPALKRWAIRFRPSGLKPAYAKPDACPLWRGASPSCRLLRGTPGAGTRPTTASARRGRPGALTGRSLTRQLGDALPLAFGASARLP